jgi:hypothetical protein
MISKEFVASVLGAFAADLLFRAKRLLGALASNFANVGKIVGVHVNNIESVTESQARRAVAEGRGPHLWGNSC